MPFSDVVTRSARGMFGLCLSHDQPRVRRRERERGGGTYLCYVPLHISEGLQCAIVFRKFLLATCRIRSRPQLINSCSHANQKCIRSIART